MVRTIVVAAVLGALIAAGAAYAVSQPAWRNSMSAWFGAPQNVPEATAATEEWPICTTMASFDAVEGLDPDFAAGKRALAAGNWQAAINALELATLRDPSNAEIHNYIGYAYHRLRHGGRRCSTISRRSRSTAAIAARTSTWVSST
jgi:hypothetical protein